MSEEDTQISSSGTRQPEEQAGPKVLFLDDQHEDPLKVRVLALPEQKESTLESVPHVLRLESGGQEETLAPTVLHLAPVRIEEDKTAARTLALPEMVVQELPFVVTPSVVVLPNAPVSGQSGSQDPVILFGGSVRQPITVTLGDLEVANAGRFTDHVVARALMIVRSQNLVGLPVTVLSSFGTASQSAYTELSGRMLALAQQEQVAALKQSLSTLASLLEGFRLADFFAGGDQGTPGAHKRGQVANPEHLFEAFYARVARAADGLDRARAEVSAIRDVFLRLLEDLALAQQEIEAHLLSLHFWSQRVFEESLRESHRLHPQAQHILAQRQQSLEASLSGIVEGQPQLDYYTQLFMELLQGAEYALWSQLPLWRTNCLHVCLMPKLEEAHASSELTALERMQGHLVAFLKHLI